MSDRVIVLIDDDRSWVEGLRALLADEGFVVEAASDGTHGLDLLENTTPVLVILDVHLPQVSGFDLLRRLRNQNRQTPVLMVSGDDQSGLVSEALTQGATTFLRKPVPNEVLLKAVRRYAAG